MKKRIKLAGMGMMFVGAAYCANAFAAGWQDDWLAQKNSSGPSYYEGQNRGYATVGSFDARWKSSSDYPVSVSMPSISAGCGGISAFGGSFSLMSVDQMVAKLQNVLQNSAGVAFQMALETVCPKCAQTLNVIESIGNDLNSMLMNDCSMATGMMVSLKDGAKAAIDAADKDKMGEMVNKGLWTSYNKVMEEVSTNGGGYVENRLKEISNIWGKPTDKDPTLAGCPGLATDIFPPDLGDKRIYLLDVIGSKYGFPEAQLNMMRGILGDVVIEGAGKAHALTTVTPCTENSSFDIDMFVRGDVYAKDKNGACGQITDTNRDLKAYVSASMTSIADKMKNKTALTAGETAFISNSPIPVAYALKVGIGTAMEGLIIENISDVTATVLAAKSMMDAISISRVIIMKSQESANKLSSSDYKGDPDPTKDPCAIIDILGNLKPELDKMMSRANMAVQQLDTKMASKIQLLGNTQKVVEYIERINDQMKKDIGDRFGLSVAQRALRKG